MPRTTINDVAYEVSERENNPSSSNYERFVGLEHYESGKAEVTKYGSTNGLDSAMKIIHAGDILIARRNVYLKRAGVVNFDGLTSGDSIVLRSYDERIGRLLPFVFNTDKFWTYANQQADGGMSKRLSPKILKEYEFNLPSLEEQEKIADLLWAAEETKNAYESQLAATEDLVKARFVEMFGDLENTIRLGDCCKVHARIGWQALTKDEHRQSGEYMLVTGTDFIDGKVNYDTCVYVEKDRYEMDQHIILKENDILITKDGTIGKVAVVQNLPKPATLNAGVFVVRPDDRFNKEYISFVFRGPLFEDFVELSKTGATIKHLNQKHLVEFMIPVPSMEEQEKFAEFSKQVDKSKFELKQAIEKIDTVIKSLSEQTFA